MRKDKEERKQYHKEYMRKKRQGLTKGLTNAQGLTDVPESAHVLPQERINTIQAALLGRAKHGLPDDSHDRWERAVSYYQWELNGRPVEGAILSAMADKLVNRRAEMGAICTAFRGSPYANDVYVGVGGPTVAEVEELLEVTN